MIDIREMIIWVMDKFSPNKKMNGWDYELEKQTLNEEPKKSVESYDDYYKNHGNYGIYF